MIKCNTCNTENENQAKFCTNCGKSLKNEINKKKKSFLKKIFIIFLFLYILIFVCNFIYVQKNIKPLIFETTFATTKYQIKASYNQKQRIININFKSDLKIQKWHKEAMGYIKPISNLGFKNKDGKDVEIKYDNINLNIGENLSFDYVLTNASLKDFKEIKKTLKTTNLSLIQSDVINANINTRQNAKNKFEQNKVYRPFTNYYRTHYQYNKYPKENSYDKEYENFYKDY